MERLRRRVVQRDQLSRGDRSFLRWGSPHGAECSFTWKDADGEWQTDLDAAFDAWLLHRDELLAEAAKHGLIPWAAREFEGMAGRVSPYEHLWQPTDTGPDG